MADESFTLEHAEELLGELRGGLDELGEAHTFDDVIGTPDIPAAGSVTFSDTGQQKYASADGNVYSTGRMSLDATTNPTLTASYATIPGLTAALAVGVYHFHAVVLINPTSSGGTLSFRVASSGGLVVGGNHWSLVLMDSGASPALDGTANYDTIDTGITGTVIGAGLANRVALIDGRVGVTTPGSINVQAKVSSGAAVVTQYGTFLDVFPL